MVKVGIIGATGYTGAELTRLLANHSEVELVALTSQSYIGLEMGAVYPSLGGHTDLICSELNLEELLARAELVFIALPHGHAVPVAQAAANSTCRVIDLGADFRLKDGAAYRHWYKVDPASNDLLATAVYGLPELYRDEINQARLVANPGCYPTCSLLGLTPLLPEKLADPESIIIDAKSGVSGAGRTLALGSHYSEVNENLKAYNVGRHRHTPEIEQELTRQAGMAVTISFTAHLIPMTRGMLCTTYVKLNRGLTTEELVAHYREFYAGETFIRVMPAGEIPQTKQVLGSNYCDIGVVADPRTGRAVIMSVIDNLVKGASGQAIQNLNLMFDLPETTGLKHPGLWP